ncbi:MAG: mannose-1-phosphate guanylyltransferase/mannose-6-phosphate isomerase [Cyanobacteria bacterium SIG30]|nr:mannose-1-phosphate guanylyltransferase/mannose-6-phosphate isomerase [Cyanobacteria bacterium SIG30]
MYGIILAGGSGSRLWPLSRELYPKQLLKLNEEKSLLENTYLRLNEIMPFENIISITNTKHAVSVKTQLAKWYQQAIILSEPTAKNTAPAIAVSVKYIIDKFEDDVILVVPSDHLIKDSKAFKKTVEEGEKLAKKGYLVTFGIKPESAHTGYGYIKTSKMKEGLKADEFKEKPDEKTAQKYYKSGDYYWNSGIFMFKASVFLNELKKCAKDIYGNLQEFNFGGQDVIDYNLFDKMPSISVDYAVMEKSKNIALVPLKSDWNDLGCWEAIYDTNDKDKEKNVKIGHVVTEKCKNSLFFSSTRLVAGVGLDDVIIIETADAVLACKKDMAQDVKKVFDKLKEVKDETHLIHTTVYRPWGYYTVLNQGEGYLTKMICVNPNAQLSLQSHNFRSEHWVVLSGTARITLEDKVFMLKAGSSIDIPVKAKHSLANPYKNELKIIEVQKGDKLIEEDIIRYKDIYGRVDE